MSVPETERGSIQVIARAAAILRCLENEPGGLSLGAIAKRIDLPRSTVQRLVDALALEQLLEIQGPAGVRLGPALMRLASHSHVDVTQKARPYLEQLSRETGETVVLLHASGAELLILQMAVSNQPLRVVPDASSFLTMHATSGGKVLLARMSDEAVTQLLGKNLKSLTPRTQTHLPDLLAELAHVRRTGVAFDADGHMPGVSAMGVELVIDQTAYALCVVAPSVRLEGARDKVRECLLATQKSMLKAFDSVR
ncbi:IclR family transcriptional regulator [Pseudomonas gingeri]|uniref:IclR family transcriptional regulator n=1 Tax=Pseudomonas gingeri TaxID=117681 RepID=UPI0015A28BF1|nr:IclR family transcriptional regulator [Pseudomonas gingeri]NWA11456.1 IclR family transcriptional regulator [Pseudomonas gingeri]